MTRYPALRARAVAAIPDTPVTVETRALARDAASYVHAIGRGWLLIAADRDLACVFGDADPLARDTILDIAAFDGMLLLPEAAGPTLGAAWHRERARVFTATPEVLGDRARDVARRGTRTVVRRLSPRDSLAHLPAELADEIVDARDTRDVYAAFCDDAPVSFAYVSLETERHGDLSIDTLDGFRRRGFGAAVLGPVIADLVARGVNPVWGAAESNAGSLALARRCGFTVPAGTMIVAVRGSG